MPKPKRCDLSKHKHFKILRSSIFAFTLFALPLNVMAKSALSECNIVFENKITPQIMDYEEIEKSLIAAPKNNVGCDKGLVITLENANLWRCHVIEKDDAPEDTWQYAFLIEQNGKIISAKKDEFMAGLYSAFRHYKVDLDGDGSFENIVALWNSQGNGLGVNRWTIRVYNSNWQEINSFEEVMDWGNSFIKPPNGRKGCDIAISSFKEDFSRPKSGTAFYAKFMMLKNGKLINATDRKPIQRRYTYNFAKIRGDHFENMTDKNDMIGNIVKFLSF